MVMRTKTIDGATVTACREDLGLTQTELADLLNEELGGTGVDKTVISKIENNKMPISAKRWLALAKVLGVHKNRLLREVAA
jgi:transcriptional regulator with XRE-family HTH domain